MTSSSHHHHEVTVFNPFLQSMVHETVHIIDVREIKPNELITMLK